MNESDDLLYLARLLLMKHDAAQKNIPGTAVTGSKEPWVMLEELVCASVPMSSAQMSTGSVPSSGLAQWVRQAYGAMRIVSRYNLGTRFAMCLPANYDAILKNLKLNQETPEPDLVVFRFMEVSVGKDSFGHWALTYNVYMPDGTTEVGFGQVTDKYMGAAVLALMEKTLATVSYSPPVKEPFSLKFRTGPYRFIVLVGFLVHTYWIGMHSFLSFHNASVLMLWLLALVVLMLFDKGES